ncbi:MAG: hypothetical protein ACNY01_12030 [Desulfobacteria bacterium]|jgi:hypothetical protein
MDIVTQVKELSSILGEIRIGNTLRKLAGIEAGRCLTRIERTKKELSVFEGRFQMESGTAWDEFNQGKLGDNADIMEWMALYENLLDFQDQYERISKSVIS